MSLAAVDFAEPPAAAAWQHRDSREGFEVVFFRQADRGYWLEGYATAVEGDDARAIRYSILVDPGWRTRRAWAAGQSVAGAREIELEGTGKGAWQVNGRAAPELDGCLDVDLEASAVTNALAVRRLRLELGEKAEAPAAYVRALDLSVARLQQHYERLKDQCGCQRYRYRAPAFDFACELTFDASGLVRLYPGIAVRVA